ncbi:hypothetical protein A2U01_0057245, partial [Trifolium medium]|nr:hypothetical protein [Trifolium medium]
MDCFGGRGQCGGLEEEQEEDQQCRLEEECLQQW